MQKEMIVSSAVHETRVGILEDEVVTELFIERERNRGVVGSLFKGRVEAATKVGHYDAIIPSIEGWAIITGYNTIFLDDRDPYVHGFSVL